MQEAFSKLKGVDIFSLKSYLEKTEAIDTTIIVMLNEILVNFSFFLLNLIVGFFSLMIRLLENTNLYDTYKRYVYNAGKSIWQGFTGSTSGGIAQTSLVFFILISLGFYLFYQFAVSKGNFSRKMIHVLLVITLGFGWFGTVSGTSGGLYVLDTVDNLADKATTALSSISVSYGKNQSLKIGSSVAGSYIAETSYKAYLFVNTGREDGQFKNQQTGKLEKWNDSKVLGKVDKSGKFKAVSTSDRRNYLDELGNNASDDKEKNRWVSAVWDYLFIKLFYVLFKIVEAIVIAVPIILIQLLNILAQALVLIMILLFPVALLISFIPKMQDVLFGVFKVMFGGLAFPAITSLLTLTILYLEKIIESAVTSGFDKVIANFASLATFSLIFKLMVSVVAKAVIYYLLWRYKGELLELLLGSRARIVIDDINYKVNDGISRSKEVINQLPSKAQNIFEAAQNSGNFILAGAGFGAGLVMNSGKHLKDFFSGHQPTAATTEEDVYPDEEVETPITDGFNTREPETSDNSMESPIMTDDTDYQGISFDNQPVAEKSSDPVQREFEERRQNRQSWFDRHRVNKLEEQLEAYRDDEAMYQAQGSNAFIRNYRKTMTKDDKLRTNINRRNHIIDELNRLRK